MKAWCGEFAATGGRPPRSRGGVCLSKWGVYMCKWGVYLINAYLNCKTSHFKKSSRILKSDNKNKVWMLTFVLIHLRCVINVRVFCRAITSSSSTLKGFSSTAMITTSRFVKAVLFVLLVSTISSLYLHMARINIARLNQVKTSGEFELGNDRGNRWSSMLSGLLVSAFET